MTKDELQASLSHLERIAQKGTLAPEVIESHKASLLQKLSHLKQLSSIDSSLSSTALLAPLPEHLRLSGAGFQESLRWEGDSNSGKTYSQEEIAAFLEQSAELLGEGLVLRGRYQLLEKLGKGRTGTVFRAEDMRYGGEYALKLFHPQILEDMRAFAQVVQAFQLAQRLHHPALARAFALDEAPRLGLAYSITEFISGQTLGKVLHRALRQNQTPPFSHRDVLDFLRALCQVLDYLHDQGVVHGDLKPNNIMLLHLGQGEDLQLRLLDIGLSRSLGHNDGPRLHSEEIDAICYIAPEQLEGGQALSPAADIFSTGVILHLMLTGQFPRQSEGRPAHFPPELQEVLRKAMSVEPTQRHSSIWSLYEDFAKALHRTFEGKPFSLPTWMMTPTPPQGRKRPSSDALRGPDLLELETFEPPHFHIAPTPNEQSTIPILPNQKSHRVSMQIAPPDKGLFPLLSLNSGRRLLASSGNLAGIQLWEIDTWRSLHTIQSPLASFETVTAMGWSPKGHLLAYACGTGDVWVWDCDLDSFVAHLHHESAIHALQWWEARPGILGVGCADGSVHLWEIEQGRHLHMCPLHEHTITSMSLHPYAPTLATSDVAGFVKLLDLESMQPLHELPRLTGGARSVAFTPKRGDLLIGAYTGMVQRWQLEGEANVLQYTGHKGPIHALATHPLLDWFAAADDSSFSLWSHTSHQNLAKYTGHQGPVRSLQLSPKGDWIASASEDGTLKIWPST